MPPLLPRLMPRAFDINQPSGGLHHQWTHPSDVFSVLLLLGGDVVGRALAQLAGTGITPVTFSYGWVAYAVAAIVSCVGENRLMPTSPDCRSIVINAKSGYVRDNSSWILGRVLRDYDYWMPQEAEEKLKAFAEVRRQEEAKAAVNEGRPPRPDSTIVRPALMVSVFKASELKTAGSPNHDVVWYSGIVVAIIQLGIASIPFGVFGDWSIFLVTLVGILLCFVTGSLPQWRAEKWACRRNTEQNYVLTRGNGALHAIVILGGGSGLNLEDLAASEPTLDLFTTWLTRVLLFILAFLWIALLICSAALQENTWFLLAVGGLGILHNSAVAGWSRKPGSFGIHLDKHQGRYFIGKKVMQALMDTEKEFPHIGRSMLETFFPGKLRDDEIREWQLLELEAKAFDADQKVERLETELARKEAEMQQKPQPTQKSEADLQKEVEKLEGKLEDARRSAAAARTTAQDARLATAKLKQEIKRLNPQAGSG